MRIELEFACDPDSDHPEVQWLRVLASDDDLPIDTPAKLREVFAMICDDPCWNDNRWKAEVEGGVQ